MCTPATVAYWQEQDMTGQIKPPRAHQQPLCSSAAKSAVLHNALPQTQRGMYAAFAAATSCRASEHAPLTVLPSMPGRCNHAAVLTSTSATTTKVLSAHTGRF
jgi:hypothetical protein